MTLLLPLLAFVFASLLVAAGAMALSGGETATLERRLGEIQIGGPIEMKPEDTEYRRAMLEMLKRVGNVAPRSSSEMGKLQQRLLAAGYRSKEALIIFFGIRAACALAFFAVVMSSIVVRPSLWVAFAACGLGYLLPSMMLGRLAKKRQHRIRLGLPDALAARARSKAGHKATLGIRPEDIHIASAADQPQYCFDAAVEVVEQLGSEILLDTRVGPALMVASVEPTLRMRAHDNLKLALKPERLHLFDAETEAAI